MKVQMELWPVEKQLTLDHQVFQTRSRDIYEIEEISNFSVFIRNSHSAVTLGCLFQWQMQHWLPPPPPPHVAAFANLKTAKE